MQPESDLPYEDASSRGYSGVDVDIPDEVEVLRLSGRRERGAGNSAD